MRQKKTAQITFRIDPNLKEAAGKAAALERRSLTSLIEKVLAKHLRNRRLLTSRRPASKEAARTALKLAAREIEAFDDDKSLPAEEREGRKRHLIRGPTEFRDIRCDQVKSTGSLAPTRPPPKKESPG
jgi:hypothetical protein